MEVQYTTTHSCTINKPEQRWNMKVMVRRHEGQDQKLGD